MEMTEDPNWEDREQLEDFQRRWRDNTLSADHPVMIKVRRCARLVAYKHGHPEQADDLEQNGRMALSGASYRGEAKLDSYIIRILENLKRHEWRKRGWKEQCELTDEVLYAEKQKFLRPEDQEFARAVERRVSSDKRVKRLLKNRPDLATMIRVITESDKVIGRKRLAELVSERLGKKITRYQVEVMLGQLRDNLDLGFNSKQPT